MAQWAFFRRNFLFYAMFCDKQRRHLKSVKPSKLPEKKKKKQQRTNEKKIIVRNTFKRIISQDWIEAKFYAKAQSQFGQEQGIIRSSREYERRAEPWMPAAKPREEWGRGAVKSQEQKPTAVRRTGFEYSVMIMTTNI